MSFEFATLAVCFMRINKRTRLGSPRISHHAAKHGIGRIHKISITFLTRDLHQILAKALLIAPEMTQVA